MEDCLLDLLFAEDLMKYVFGSVSIPWTPEKGIGTIREQLGRSPFEIEIGSAVMKIIDEHDLDLEECCMELKRMGIYDGQSFGLHALKAAPSYFSKGYSAESFLCYCAIVLGVACDYLTFPSNGIPECAAQVVALVLQSHRLTGEFHKRGGWEDLLLISQTLNFLLDDTN